MSTIKKYTPFTLEHFMQALQSLNDEMLMYYIDEAVAIYCRLRGWSVGSRPVFSFSAKPSEHPVFCRFDINS